MIDETCKYNCKESIKLKKKAPIMIFTGFQPPNMTTQMAINPRPAVIPSENRVRIPIVR